MKLSRDLGPPWVNGTLEDALHEHSFMKVPQSTGISFN